MFHNRRWRRAALTVAAVTATTIAAVVPAEAALAAVNGIDVSSYQHPRGAAINWAAVRASGRTFAFVKATESTNYANPYLPSDRAAAKRYGIAVGAYHMARPSTAAGDASAEARWYVSRAGRSRTAGDLPPVLDLEFSGGLSPAALTVWTRTWLATVKSLTGRTPILYTFPYFYQSALRSTKLLAGYPLWMASYSSVPSRAMSSAWSRWTFWQNSATGRVSGISGAVDTDVFNGTQASLNALALRSAAPAPRPAPAPGARVTARLSTASTVRGHRVYLTGAVSPSRAGDVVIRQGYYSGAWHTWATSRVSSRGTYAFAVTPTVAAVNYYRVYAPTTTRHRGTASGVLRLVVR